MWKYLQTTLILKPEELGSWNFEGRFTSPPHVMCHVSQVLCPKSKIAFLKLENLEFLFIFEVWCNRSSYSETKKKSFLQVVLALPSANSTILHSPPIMCYCQDTSSIIANPPKTHPISKGQLNFCLYRQHKKQPPLRKKSLIINSSLYTLHGRILITSNATLK